MFTNKYAEGYPGRRYYGGCEYTDVVENLARDRAKQLFGAEHANVQPHSGSHGQHGGLRGGAEAGRHDSWARPGAWRPPDARASRSTSRGKMYQHRSLRRDRRRPRRIDYDELEQLAEREKPKLIIGGGSAYPRILDFARMRQIADKVGAHLSGRHGAHSPGWWPAACIPRPVPHAHIATTTTHKTLRGPRAGLILCRQEYWPRPSTRPCFPGSRADRWCTLWRPKRCASTKRCSPSSRTMPRQIVANAKVLAAGAGRRRASASSPAAPTII